MCQPINNREPMNTIRLSPAASAMFRLCGLPSIDGMEPAAGLAILDQALDDARPSDAIAVVNLRILEKIRNIQSAEHGIAQTQPRQLRPYASNLH